MAIIIKNTAKQYPLPPADNHVARCIGIIDMGTFTEETPFGVKVNRKLRITWELPNEQMEFEEGKGKQPFTISKGFNISMHEKSSLRKFLEAWRGQKFTDAELKGFDVTVLLGKACMLNVTHDSVEDKTYANVTSATKIPKGLECPDAINPLVSYSVSSHDEEVFAKLPEFLQKKIKECHEFNEPKKTAAPASSKAAEPADELMQEAGF